MTESGKKSAMQDVFPADDTDVVFEVNKGTAKKPKMEQFRDAVKNLVKKFVRADLAMKAAKEEQEEAGTGIRVYSKAIREHQAKAGQYQTTYRINGPVSKDVQYAVSAAAQDRFSLPKKDDEIDAIKEIVGNEFFSKFFERVLNISIRKEILDDPAKRRELTDKLLNAFGGEEGLKKWFKKEEVWSVRKGLDVAQFNELDDDTRRQLNEVCPQYADQLKDASYDASTAA
jgi:hypothetical protein